MGSGRDYVKQGSRINDTLLNQPFSQAGGFPQVYKTGAGSVVGFTTANPNGGAPLPAPYYSSHVSGLPGYDPNAGPVQRPITTGNTPSGWPGSTGPNLGAANIHPSYFQAGYGSGGVSGGMGGVGGGAQFGAGAGPGPGQGYLSRPGAMDYQGNQPVNMGQGSMGTPQLSMFGQPMNQGMMGMSNQGMFNPNISMQGQQINPMNMQPGSGGGGGGVGGGGAPVTPAAGGGGFYDSLLSGGGGGGGGMAPSGGGGSQIQGGGGQPQQPFSFFSGPNSNPTQQQPNSMQMQQQSPQSSLMGSTPQPDPTYGRFNAGRQATSPGNLASEAAAQYDISNYGQRAGYALPQPGGGGGGPGSIGNFSTTGQAETLPSGLGGSRTVSGLTGGNQQNYLMTGQQNSGGGLLSSPGDVDFFLELGIITPEQADGLRQVGSKNKEAGDEYTKSLGSYAPGSSAYNSEQADARRFRV